MEKTQNKHVTHTPDVQNSQIEGFDSWYFNVLINARGTMFGMMMTIIDTLNLPESQHKAIKSLIARDIDVVVLDIIRGRFEEGLKKNLGYESKKEQSVTALN